MKLLIHLAKKITKVKRKKLRKLSGEGDIKELGGDRFTEHLGLFTFCGSLQILIITLGNLVTLGSSFVDLKNILNTSANPDKVN